jgi:hypothetical protein
MLELMALAIIGSALFVGFVVLATIFKLAFKILLLPLLLLKFLIFGVVFTIVGPILLIVGVFAVVVTGLVGLVPLLPFLIVGGLVWMLVRNNRRPAVI